MKGLVPLEGFLMAGRDLNRVKIKESHSGGKTLFEGDIADLFNVMEDLNLFTASVTVWSMDGSICEITVVRD